MVESAFLLNYFTGGVSAAITAISYAPIERVKLLIQTQNELIKQGILDKSYTGIIDCFKRTAAEEGLIAFWRGNSATIIRYFPAQALTFAFRDKIKATFDFNKNDDYFKWFLGNLVSGSVAGGLSLLLVYSLDYARTKLATDIKSAKNGGKRQFNDLLDVYKKTIASDGVAGLYRGFLPSLVGIVVYRGLYFGLFDSLKPLVLDDSLKNSFLASFILGWVVTISASTASYPLETITRRMMVTSTLAVKYNGPIDCFQKIVATEGFSALFKGYSVIILKSVSGALVISLYSLLQQNQNKKLV